MKLKIYMSIALLAVIAFLSVTKAIKIALLILCGVVLVHLFIRGLRRS